MTDTLERATSSYFGKGAHEYTIGVRGLQHHFGEGELRKQVLFDNRLLVAAGEIVIMTGPSGSGKTTLLTLMGSLRTVQEGSLRLLGNELRGASKDQIIALRHQLGFIFQHHNLFASLTAYQNVNMAAELIGLDRKTADERIRELLDRLGLSHRIHYKPAQLSGGQKQRVAIARGLVHRPRLVLADEPTAALDAQSGRAAMEILQEMANDDGATIVLVTHDNRILDFADRIVNMVDGRVKSDSMVKEAAKICEYLKTSDIFSAHPVTTLTSIADHMLIKDAGQGETVIRQGDPGDKFYLIRNGKVDVVVETDEGQSKVTELGPGAYFGEMALLTGEPRSATIIASEDCIFYTLDKDEFQRVVQESPTFEEQLRQAIFDRQ